MRLENTHTVFIWGKLNTFYQVYNLRMNLQNFERTKGQSAIEYLMTYGWMLLVVAIVGGAIFATVQGQCVQSTSGFSGADVQVENFGIDGSNNLQMEVRNAGTDSLNITDVQIDETSVGVNGTSVEITSTGDTAQVTTSTGTFENVDGCNDYDLTLVYDVGDTLQDQRTTGTLTDSIDFTAP